jgi:hypothetical protein
MSNRQFGVCPLVLLLIKFYLLSDTPVKFIEQIAGMLYTLFGNKEAVLGKNGSFFHNVSYI